MEKRKAHDVKRVILLLLLLVLATTTLLLIIISIKLSYNNASGDDVVT